MKVKNRDRGLFDCNTVFLFSILHPEGKSKKEKGAPIQRSTETGMAVELTRNMSRQPSRESNNGSMNSYNSEGKSVNHTLPVLVTLLTVALYPPVCSGHNAQRLCSHVELHPVEAAVA